MTAQNNTIEKIISGTHCMEFERETGVWMPVPVQSAPLVQVVEPSPLVVYQAEPERQFIDLPTSHPSAPDLELIAKRSLAVAIPVAIVGGTGAAVVTVAMAAIQAVPVVVGFVVVVGKFVVLAAVAVSAVGLFWPKKSEAATDVEVQQQPAKTIINNIQINN